MALRIAVQPLQLGGHADIRLQTVSAALSHSSALQRWKNSTTTLRSHQGWHNYKLRQPAPRSLRISLRASSSLGVLARDRCFRDKLATLTRSEFDPGDQFIDMASQSVAQRQFALEPK